MRGRKPLPTNVINIAGNPGKQKKRAKSEPKPQSEIPTPPEHLNEYALEEWNRLAEGLYTLGLLYDVDRAPFAAYCSAYGAWRKAEEELNATGLTIISGNGMVIPNPLVGITNTAKRDMMKYAVEFGMTPSARARMAIQPRGKETSKFEGLIGGAGK